MNDENHQILRERISHFQCEVENIKRTKKDDIQMLNFALERIRFYLKDVEKSNLYDKQQLFNKLKIVELELQKFILEVI